MSLLIASCTLASFIIIYLAIKFAWKINFLSHPNAIFVSQKKPVAYLGGLAIFIAILFNTLVWTSLISNKLTIEINTLLILLFFTSIGLIDDYFELKPTVKLILQIIGAILAMSLGYYIEFTTLIFVNYILSAFALVLIVNAFNLIDVSDGLLVSIFLPILLFFYLFSENNVFLIIIGISVSSFLFYNKPDAKIYLGDSGSHFLGCLAYVFCIDFVDSSIIISNTMTLILVFSVVIFELVFLLYRRLKQGLSIFKGSPDHYSILLRKASWSKEKIMIASFFTSIFFASIAYISVFYSLATKSILLVVTIIIYFLLGRFINNVSNEKK